MIDPKIQQELKERFSPEGSLLRKIQLRQLEILDYVDEVCKKHHIPYWLSSGTLLGAARHEGFIPWDDDVDVEMMYPDFKRFCAIMENDTHPVFRLQTHRTDPNYFAKFAKVRDTKSFLEENRKADIWFKYRGLYVDIFALEKCNSHILAKLTRSIQRKLVRASCNKNRTKVVILTNFYNVVNHILCAIFRPICHLLPGNRLRHVLGTGFLKPRYQEEIFPLTQIQFEGKMYPAPRDTDAYLRHIYGDYTELPDLDKLHKHIINIRFE